MLCMACGAEMILMNVNRDDTMAVLGFEYHSFRCSACYETEQPVVFIKDGRETGAAPLPVQPQSPIVPSSAGQHERVAAPGRFSAVQRALASYAQALIAVLRRIAYRALIAYLCTPAAVRAASRAMVWFMRLIAHAVASTITLLRAIGVEFALARERAAARLFAAAHRCSSEAGRTCIMGATFPVRLVARSLIRIFPLVIKSQQ
jgi:hypothetical protein